MAPLPVATCQPFDVIGNKAREIAGDDTVTIGNEKSRPWSARGKSPKLRHQSSGTPFSTDDRSGRYLERDTTRAWRGILQMDYGLLSQKIHSY